MGKDEIDIVILGMLMSGPAHGYQLRQNIREEFYKHILNLSVNSLYTRLSRFEIEGLIEGHREVQENAPSKMIYGITEKGRQRFIALLSRPPAITGLIYADLQNMTVHAVFFSYLSREQRQKVVEPLYGYYREQIGDAEEALKHSDHQFSISQKVMICMSKDVMEKALEYLDVLVSQP